MLFKTNPNICQIIYCLLLFLFLPKGTILDHLVGEDVMADYLLYSLNRLQKFR